MALDTNDPKIWVTTTTTGANQTITWPTGTIWDSSWITSTAGGDWMAHPMTLDEVIEQEGKRLAKLRPAEG